MRRTGDRAVVADLARCLAEAEPVVLVTVIGTDGTPPCAVGQKLLVGEGGPISGTLGCAELDARAEADAAESLAAASPMRRRYAHAASALEVQLEPYPPVPRLVILGATPVARALVEMSGVLGWECAVVDPRPERLATLAGLHCTTATEATALAPRAADAVVATDHDAPRLAEHIAELFGRMPRFVGMMGSRSHTAAHLAALAARGLTPAQLEAVETPVGLDLGGRSPAEIALSILAGIVASDHASSGGRLRARPASNAAS